MSWPMPIPFSTAADRTAFLDLLENLPRTQAVERIVFGKFPRGKPQDFYHFSSFSTDFSKPTPTSESFFKRVLQQAVPTRLFEGSMHERLEWRIRLEQPGFLWSRPLVENAFFRKFNAMEFLKQHQKPIFHWPQGDLSYQQIAQDFKDPVVFQTLSNTITENFLVHVRRGTLQSAW